MQRIHRQMGWASVTTFVSAAVVAVGLSFSPAPAQAAFELPAGEKITNVPAIPRAMPIKEAYELYDPKIGKNFDVKNFWLRADLRVRPEMRTNTCFGSTMAGTGNCNNRNTTSTANGTRGQQNDQFTQQMTRLGIGYDVSPDVNFYMELINSANWGTNSDTGNGNAAGAQGTGKDPALNHGQVGVRAAYMLVRNFAGVQGLSVKAGRQYVIFGNHSLFGHFDWANTGFSHDGIMLNYSTKSFDTYLGWFRTHEGDMNSGTPTGSVSTGVGTNPQTSAGGNDSDMLIFYNQIKSIPGFLIEPYYIGYRNNGKPLNGVQLNAGAGIGTPKHSNQLRHTVGNRIEMRKGNFDATNEIVYQFGSMGDQMSSTANEESAQGRNLSINAWATRNWLGYTHYQSSWKPRFAANFDYASGDGRAQCGAGGQGTCRTANTFENLFPTNHIHMGYMDVQAWKNMMSPSVNFQARPTKDDHIEVWATSLNLANKEDNWYRGGQGAYVYSKVGNTKKHIGDELDVAYTHMFMDGKLAFQAAYGHLFAGGYIAENLGTSRDQDWAYAQLWLNF